MKFRAIARSIYRRCVPDYGDPRFPFTATDEAAEAKRMAQPLPTEEEPVFTLIMQFHNRGRDAAAVVRNFRDTCPFPNEIIAIDDGSRDDTLQRLAAEAQRPQDFVLHANDIFEIKTYNRALMMARGDYVVFLQDDDYAPSDRWSVEAERIFRKCPDIAVLGGRDGVELYPLDRVPDTDNAIAWARRSDLQWEPDRHFHWSGVCKYDIFPQHSVDTLRLVDAVNMAPYLVRRSVALELGAFDEIFAPFQINDVDFCLRAIERGYGVAVFHSGVKQGKYKSGMRSSRRARLRTTRQSFRNWRILYSRHASLIASRASQRIEARKKGETE